MKDSDIAVRVKNIHKEFILPQHKSSTFKQSFVNIVRKNNRTTQKVLNGVSFNVKKGEFFGIVGRNGSGKSTLLKLMAGVYTPTSGSIEINGGLTPFIELGVGFNPELSGRDNVYLNGALLGFNRKQMDAMYDDIVAFAELEPFMDQKLKNYSSGMQVRLAFSIAVKAENDILIFDEVLAVGDSNFQEKSIRQFKRFKREGKTIILVTHSMEVVEKFCDRVVLIDSGNIAYEGDANGAVETYEKINMRDNNLTEKNRNDQEQVSIKASISDKYGKKAKIILPESDFSIDLGIRSNVNIKNAFLAVRVFESENQLAVIGLDNDLDKHQLNIKKGDNRVIIDIKNNPIRNGKYYLVAGLYESKKRNINYGHYNGLNNSNLFLIKGEKDPGIIEVFRKWH